MGAQTSKLIQHEQVAEGTMAFYFDRPAGFEFVGGQSIDLTLIDPPQTDAEGNMRTFSLASAPDEADLMVVTRMRDTAFKRVIKFLPAGSEVTLEGPFGSMTLHRKTTRPAVILAGGIGITPFRSMILQALQAHTGHRLFLFYSNRRPEDAAFLGEFNELSRQHSNFTLIATMTNMQASKVPWSGPTGHIKLEMVEKLAGDLAGAVYYTAGPPALVAAMREMLSEAGVEEDDINSEGFSGY